MCIYIVLLGWIVHGDCGISKEQRGRKKTGNFPTNTKSTCQQFNMSNQNLSLAISLTNIYHQIYTVQQFGGCVMFCSTSIVPYSHPTKRLGNHHGKLAAGVSPFQVRVAKRKPTSKIARFPYLNSCFKWGTLKWWFGSLTLLSIYIYNAP